MVGPGQETGKEPGAPGGGCCTPQVTPEIRGRRAMSESSCVEAGRLRGRGSANHAEMRLTAFSRPGGVCLPVVGPLLRLIRVLVLGGGGE